MKRSKFVVAALASVSLLGVSGCVTDPNTGEQKISRTAVGGVLGAGAGAAVFLRILDHAVEGVAGSATISPAFRDLLDNVASSLRQYPNSLIDVYGYTDTVGSSAANQRLSDQRAQAVANYLTSQGVASSRIRWMGFGETQLKVQTGDNVAQPLNRRVEIKIIPFDAQDVNEARQQGM